MSKSSVSALQEFCAQNKLPQPDYTYMEGDDGGFVCKVEVLDMEAYGNGRSKRDAKHLSALQLMKKIRVESGDGVSLDNACTIHNMDTDMTNMNRDMLKELRDYCVQHDMPLPVVDIVQQSGTPDAPEFVALCTVASIKRYAASDKKKDARQKAAIEMLRVICSDADDFRDHMMQVTPTGGSQTTPNETSDDLEAERRLKFKTYRDLTESGNNEMYGIKLCDRHNYFKNYFPHLKKAAVEVIKSDEYEDDRSKAQDILSALKLETRITHVECETAEPILFIELNSEYDCVFLGHDSKIWGQIITYFSEMLY